MKDGWTRLIIKGAPRAVSSPRRIPSHTVPLVEAISPCVEGANFDECTISGPMFTITGRVNAPSGPLAPIGITVAEVQIIVFGDEDEETRIVVPLLSMGGTFATDGTFGAEVPNVRPGEGEVLLLADTSDGALRGVGGFSFTSVESAGAPAISFNVTPFPDLPLNSGRLG